MGNLFVKALAALVEANEAMGASPKEAFHLAFAQVMVATHEELELLAV